MAGRRDVSKVLLMLGHFDARIGDGLLNKYARMPFEGPMPDYERMVDGTGPPADLSVFVFNAVLSAGPEEPVFRLALPAAVLHEDGTTRHCHTLSLATPGLCVTVVSHPGATVDHPLVRRGEAWELLRSPPDGGDLSGLPAFSHKHVAFARGGGIPAGHVIDESGFSYLSGLFGIGYETEEDAAPDGAARGIERALDVPASAPAGATGAGTADGPGRQGATDGGFWSRVKFGLRSLRRGRGPTRRS